LAQEEQPNFSPCTHINKDEVKKALRKMKVGKAIDPDNIPVEIWKSLGEKGLECLTSFFNVILETAMMPKNGDMVYSYLCTRIKGCPGMQQL